ncbi:Clp1 [Colletotrichum higginsianum]|uniref:Clp1 n=1 Tax=Colletotrichum higginsianum (strain IMI 349063) TaxID=759273 RepID=H1UV88_COLHI|nr:Clp1 [Colletotrichum higginsianum]
MAATVTSRLGKDAEVKSSGMIIDTPAVSENSVNGMDILAHIVDELSGRASDDIPCPRWVPASTRLFL